MQMYKAALKPATDFILSFTAIILLLPLILIIGMVIYITQGKPVFFCQERPGKNGEIFMLYKFRTMTNEVSKVGDLMSDSQRLTTIGRFLRRFSLDELPQLLNVIRGELSIVGPRPLLVEYLKYYTEEQSRRHQVKPGITGWAQVNGRNSLTWEEKFALDVYYVDNISFWLDFRIIVKTFARVFMNSDIYNEKGNTMEKFTGSKQ
jgi:lipopolysaccharide/colanic/teichoic acid biosynthesis glycosyltransferase